MKRLLITASLAIALAAAGFSAHALNPTPLLKGGPGEKFNERDNELFMQTFESALQETAAGPAKKWENPDTKSNGSIRVVEVYEEKGMPCKRLRIENHAKGRNAAGNWYVCQNADKQWMFAPAKTKSK